MYEDDYNEKQDWYDDSDDEEDYDEEGYDYSDCLSTEQDYINRRVDSYDYFYNTLRAMYGG